MKKLLVLLCASAIIISACSSAEEPVVHSTQTSAPVKHKHHKGINYNK